MSDAWRTHRVLLLTLDPVHVGTGGYRLGRVDNSIVREPGTNLPKVPGTSLSGAVRTYAAYRYESPRCAGQGQADRKTGAQGHCGDGKCPICYTFGSLTTKTADGEQQAHAGVVSLCDAHVLCFPVHSLAGPVWVSTYQRLCDWEVLQNEPDEFDLEETCFVTSLPNWDKPLNLGWLMLEKAEQAEMPKLDIAFREEDQENRGAWQAIEKRLVLVGDKVFSQVVNSNLEVRTSVAIDPTTGAAKEGALFTYEALPRATWLVMDVVEDDYRWEKDQDGVKFEDGKPKTAFPVTRESKISQQKLDWDAPWKVVRAGLELIEALGVGGMGTRGFGRLRRITDWSLNGEGASDG